MIKLDPELMKVLSQFVQLLLEAILVPLAALVTIYVRRWFMAQLVKLEATTSAQDWYLIQEAVRTAVLSAEQSGLAGYITNTGAEKKMEALRVAQEQLNAWGLVGVDVERLEALIEAAVYAELSVPESAPAVLSVGVVPARDAK